MESLSLLHKIAMVQLLPSMLDNHYAAIEPRLRELARTLPPADIQLYYQTLLVGRKELAYAPDRRMGVEMTLLRALAFHPKAIIAEPQIAHVAAPSAIADNAVPTSQGGQHRQEPASVPPSSHQEAPPLGAVASSVQLPESTAQLLQARTQLLRQSGTTTTKRMSRRRQEKRGRQTQHWSV